MKTLKPILGIKKVKVLSAEKKGTDERFTITIKMQLENSERTITDNLFYDVENTNRASVLPAIFTAWCNQMDLDITKFRKESEDTYEWDEDKLLKAIIGKEMTVERYTTQSERNSVVYYNMNYNPNIAEEAPEL